MENLIFGVLTVFIVAIIFFHAFKQHKKGNNDYSAILIALGGFLLRVYTACDFYLHEWDERYHALVAKNLLENPFVPMLYKTPILEYDYRNWGENHVWLHKQPIPLYTMALSMLIFGKNVIALRIPSIILSTLSIFSTFKIGQHLYNKNVGLLAAFLFSINGLIIELTAGRVATDHNDVFFFSLISFSVLFMLKHAKLKKTKYLFYGSLFTGLAILTKWLPGLIVIPIWVLALVGKNDYGFILKNVMLFIFLVIVIVLPWQVYIHAYFPLEAAWEAKFNQKHIFEALEGHEHPFYYHFDKMRIIFGELIYLPLLWLFYTAFKQWYDYRKLVLLVWILIPYLFFTFVQTKMKAYILFTAPAVFIMIALYYEHLKKVMLNSNKQFKLLSILVSALLFILPVRYSIERVKPFQIRERSLEWVEKIEVLNENKSDASTVIFNTKYPIETMFYTDFLAYETLPANTLIKELIDKNYKVIIDNYKPIPSNVQNIDAVKFINITN